MAKSDFPPPPESNRSFQGSAPTPPIGPVAPTATGDGPSFSPSLTHDETRLILERNLLPEHLEDPNVLRFIRSYLACRSPSQAAREAGMTPQSGQQLKGRPDIHAAISALTLKSLDKYGFDASEIVERVKEIASLDLADFENPDGSYKSRISEIPAEARRAIKKIKVKNVFGTDPNGLKIITGEIIEIELWDKLKSLELLGREKGVFKETKVIQHDVTKDMASVLLASKARADERFNLMHDVTTPKEITGRIENEFPPLPDSTDNSR